MKTLLSCLLIIFIVPLPCQPKQGTQLRQTCCDIIALKDVPTKITTLTHTLLKSEDLDSTTLSPKQVIILQEKINFVTQTITERIIRQKKNGIPLSTLNDFVKFQLTPFIKETLATIPATKLEPAFETHCAKVLNINKIKLSKLPEKLQNEFVAKKQQVITQLELFMQKNNRDYITLQELETTFNEILGAFIEHASYVMLSVGLQNIMQQINTLKIITHTQPYPTNQEIKG
jgi:hypothetical protein